MSRTHLPFAVDDLSAFAKALRGQLVDCDQAPSHLTLLNMLARAAGHKNFQQLRAQGAARERLEAPRPVPETVDFVRLRRLARHFDADGRLVRWPPKWSEQRTCLWVLWSRIPARQVFTECEVNRRLSACHLFGDPALLRRELCDQGLMARTPDCREYRRVECRPTAEGLALIHYLRGASGAAEAAT